MGRRRQIGEFLGRLEATVTEQEGPLERRQEAESAPYRRKGEWPGPGYILVGHSYNLEYRLVGTEFQARRAGSIALMLEECGNRNRQAPLGDALAFEGFREILSRFESDWLGRLPAETLLGPAYSKDGSPIRTAFAVWQPAGAARETAVLVEA